MDRDRGSGARSWGGGRRLGRDALALGLVAVLAACGSKIGGFGSSQAGAKAHAAPVRATGAAPGADLVTAVPAGKINDTVSLKFEIKSKPTPAQPVDIDLELTPSQDFDSVQLSLRAADGLLIQTGDTMEVAERPPVGKALRYTATVVPKADGIYYISATVLTTTPSGTISYTYSIPVIAGDGLQDTATKTTSEPAVATAAPGPAPAPVPAAGAGKSP